MGRDTSKPVRKRSKAAAAILPLKKSLEILRSQPHTRDQLLKKGNYFRFLVHELLCTEAELKNEERYKSVLPRILKTLGTSDKELRELFGRDPLAFKSPYDQELVGAR